MLVTLERDLLSLWQQRFNPSKVKQGIAVVILLHGA